MPGLALVGLAHVDHLPAAVAVAHQLGHALGRQLAIGSGERAHRFETTRSRPQPPGPRAMSGVQCHQLVCARRPVAQQRPSVARIDDLLHGEALGGAKRRAHGVQPLLDLACAVPPGRAPPPARGGRRPRSRPRSAASPNRPRARRSAGSGASRPHARRPPLRTPCAPGSTPTARGPGAPRTAPGRRGGWCPPARLRSPITNPGWSTKLTTGRWNWSQVDEARELFRRGGAGARRRSGWGRRPALPPAGRPADPER